MTDEEKKAIERIEDVFYQDLGKGINKIQKITLYEDSITDIRTVLNLIEKQSKIIQAMAEKISEYKDYLEGIPEDDMWHEECFLYNKISDCYAYNDCEECIIEYFTKKVGE